ncbi:hypothetical protein Q0F99_02490 [Rathayibacter oskolensis]|uniref:hypothetical protein n=1 Tax=Rathayibacter oskolensis TaxID=1891671 RepID=UPI00265F0B52|nr:hypothetical protein [Rathayibacter oskolensis]WKK71996.1 hypothetical protein Q0F99_02490 [Rathayibacter oskolensis]
MPLEQFLAPEQWLAVRIDHPQRVIGRGHRAPERGEAGQVEDRLREVRDRQAVHDGECREGGAPVLGDSVAGAAADVRRTLDVNGLPERLDEGRPQTTAADSRRKNGKLQVAATASIRARYRSSTDASAHAVAEAYTPRRSRTYCSDRPHASPRNSSTSLMRR